MLRRLIGWAAALVFTVAVAGCATTDPDSGKPCQKCSHGYVTVRKSAERHYLCMIDGKQVDCTKNPSECPGCRK